MLAFSRLLLCCLVLAGSGTALIGGSTSKFIALQHLNEMIGSP